MKTAFALMLRDVRTIPAPILEAIRTSLPTAEKDGRTWNLKSIPVRWTQGDKKAALRRNAIAAAECSALVVCKGDRFSAAAIRAFRHRGRTCYFWTGSKLIEERITPKKQFNPEPSADSNQLDEITHQIFPTVTTIPAQPIIEAQIWMDAAIEARQKRELAYANFRGYRPVKDENARMIADINHCADAMTTWNRNHVAPNWNEKVACECSTEDVLHPSNNVHGIAVDPRKMLTLLTAYIYTVKKFTKFQASLSK